MANVAVVQAFEAAFAATWPIVPIVATSAKSGPPAGVNMFVMLQYPFATNEQITFGAPASNLFREVGAVRFILHVAYPDDENSDADARIQALEFAEEVAVEFRSARVSGIRTLAPTSPLEDDTNENGRFYVLSFTVPYEFDTFG